MAMADLLIHRLDRTAEALRMRADGLTDEEARRVLPPALSPITWQIAHVAVADDGIFRRLGRHSLVPEAWPTLFTGELKGEYPTLGEALGAFERVHAALREFAASAPLETAIEGSRSYATLGEALTFVAYHRGYHIGKMATLRALLGRRA